MASGSSDQPDPRQGMTLIELLLALIIVVLVVTVAMSLYHTVSSALRGQTERLDGVVPASDALRQLTRDLTCAFAPPGQTACHLTLKQAQNSQEPAWELSFCTAVPTTTDPDIPWAEIRQVNYTWTTNSTSGTLTLHYSSQPMTGPEALAPAQTNAVVPGIQRLKLEAFDGETWHEEWPPKEAPLLPRALRVDWQSGEDRQAQPLMTEIFIPAGNPIPSTRMRSSVPAP